MQHILQYLQGRDSNPSPRYSVIGFTSQPVARFCWKQPHLRSLSSLKCASLELFKSDDSYCNMATLRGPRLLSYTAHPRTILVLSCLSSIFRWLLLCQGQLVFDNSYLFLSILWLTNPFVQKDSTKNVKLSASARGQFDRHSRFGVVGVDGKL